MIVARIKKLLGVSALICLLVALAGCKEETNVTSLSTVDTVKGANSEESQAVFD